MTFRIDHPRRARVYAEYGFDHAVGFFVTVFRGERGEKVLATYDALQPGYAHLDGAGRFLVAHRFYSEDDYEQAIVQLSYELPEEMPARLRRCAEVVCNLKMAAD